MDVSAIEAPKSDMTLEEYIEQLFSLQQAHLRKHVESKLDVRTT